MNKEGVNGHINSINRKRKSKVFAASSILSQRRAQATIFIIIAVVIVGLAVLFFFLLPGTKVTPGFDEQNPAAFIQTCLENQIASVIENVSLQGGSVSPESFILYQDSRVEYLCYTSEYYVPCIVQQPLLKQHIESEIRDGIAADVVSCFKSLKENYEQRNYDFGMTPKGTTVELLPKRIVTNLNYAVTISKGQTKRYESFSVILNNNLYELISIANSIIEWETTYGDAETTAYMTYYHDLKVEKKGQDSSKIYILTDRNTGEKFQFASRSVVWPSGYGSVPVFGNE